MGCKLLYRVLGLDPKLTSHLVSVVVAHPGIELLVIACYRPSHRRGMGDEEGMYLGSMELEVE